MLVNLTLNFQFTDTMYFVIEILKHLMSNNVSEADFLNNHVTKIVI